jgi:two-component system, sensor histidine kinase and response regulator
MTLRILVVEDNELNAELARDLLERSGHVVTIARDRVELLRQLGVQPPDIVLMDLLLPDADGSELLVELRRIAAFGRVPVVAVTAQALAGDTERLLARGFDGVLTKPIDTRTFVAAVQGLAAAGRR